MQYILTEEEYDALKEKEHIADKAPSQEKLQELCTMVANEVPVKSGWYKGKPWGCILTVKHEWYCDDCPAKKLCPHPRKHWSQ